MGDLPVAKLTEFLRYCNLVSSPRRSQLVDPIRVTFEGESIPASEESVLFSV